MHLVLDKLITRAFGLKGFLGLFTLGLGEQVKQNGRMTYIKKNGSQQTMKVVTMTAIVLAALRSLDNEILAFSLMNLCISDSVAAAVHCYQHKKNPL